MKPKGKTIPIKAIKMYFHGIQFDVDKVVLNLSADNKVKNGFKKP